MNIFTYPSALSDLMDATRVPNLTIRQLLALDAGSPRIVAENTHFSMAIRALMAIVSRMKYTNRHNLPDPVVRALTSYEKGQSVEGLRVTTLIDSPRISELRKQYSGHLTEDVSDLMWRVLGTAIHEVFERATSNAYVSEERLSYTIDDTLISGAIDYQFESDGEVDLKDYKYTSTYKITFGDHSDWERQLNVYAYLIRRVKKFTVRSASVIAILRDWRRADADRKADYPQSSIMEIPITLWSDEEQDVYVSDRVRLHNIAEKKAEFGDLPLCGDTERWARPAQYAVKKGENKRALRVFGTEEDAKAYAEKDSTRHVEVRPATYTRCVNNYCRVADFCTQWKDGN